MIDAYSQIIAYEQDNWEDFLEQICLYNLFKPVISSYKDKDTLTRVIKYIVYAYSKGSDKIVLGMEWQKNKQQIFEFVLAKPVVGIYEDLVLLKNNEVVQSVHNWLEFQDSDAFKQLQVLRDLRIEMQLSANGSIVKANGEQDYTQKFLNAEYAMKLKNMIKDLEQELIQNDGKLKEAVKEVKAKEKNNTQRSVGSYAVS